MRIDTRKTIKNYDGSDFPTKEKPLTILEILDTALNQNLATETPTAEDKAKRYQLSMKLYKSKEIDLTLDDRSFLKERVNKVYTHPLVCGRVSDLLEGKVETGDNQQTASESKDPAPAKP